MFLNMFFPCFFLVISNKLPTFAQTFRTENLSATPKRRVTGKGVAVPKRPDKNARHNLQCNTSNPLF